jgi:hypothetical protein
MFSPPRTARPMRPRSGSATGGARYAGAGKVWFTHDGVPPVGAEMTPLYAMDDRLDGHWLVSM